MNPAEMLANIILYGLIVAMAVDWVLDIFRRRRNLRRYRAHLHSLRQSV